MRRIVIHKPGGYDRLKIEEHPDLQPGSGEVLIQVEAIGVNYADCVVRMGLYSSARHYGGYPITPGFEVAGTVAALGEEVEGPSIGTAVIGLTRFGGYATQVVVSADMAFPIPKKITMAEAAAFPTVFVTAWYGLIKLCHPEKGETVLIHSAAGGVGTALVQLAKIAQCRVTGVVGSSHKVDVVKALGADAVIDKSQENLWTRAEQMAPEGYDIVLDANGVSTLQDSYNHLGKGGRLVIYGFHTMLPQEGRMNWLKLAWNYMRTPRFSPFDLTGENRTVTGFNLSYMFEKAEVIAPGIRQLLEWADEGRINVPKITTYPFTEAANAHRELESGQTVGKLVLLTEDA
ncbi:MAG: medium chain dehydrogenase/reductase family protein [Verrucomicrobia bacterium]|nr:medium chain dehydrogenase/reductase family protein [Verrucomicrobiota bacterium]